MPGVLYIPHLCMLWDTISETVRATLTTLLLDIPPTAPLLILALSNRPYASLSPEVQVTNYLNVWIKKILLKTNNIITKFLLL